MPCSLRMRHWSLRGPSHAPCANAHIPRVEESIENIGSDIKARIRSPCGGILYLTIRYDSSFQMIAPNSPSSKYLQSGVILCSDAAFVCTFYPAFTAFEAAQRTSGDQPRESPKPPWPFPKSSLYWPSGCGWIQ